MKRILILAGVAILLGNCSSRRCIADKAFVKDYRQHLQIIIKQEKGDSTDVDEYFDALKYFYKITGSFLRAKYDNGLGYQDKSVYKEDVKRLKMWLEENKCTFTKEMADSVSRIPWGPNLLSPKRGISQGNSLRQYFSQ